MFFTGLSSPIVSIMMAALLPWVLFFFGKSSSLEIIGDSGKVIEIKAQANPDITIASVFDFKEKQQTNIQGQSGLSIGFSYQYIFSRLKHVLRPHVLNCHSHIYHLPVLRAPPVV